MGEFKGLSLSMGHGFARTPARERVDEVSEKLGSDFKGLRIIGKSQKGGYHSFTPSRVRVKKVSDKLVTARDRIYDSNRRLQDRILFEHDDFATVMKRYDAPLTLQYLDPPYEGTNIGESYSGDGTEKNRYSDKRFIGTMKLMNKADFVVSHGESLEEPLKELGFRVVFRGKIRNMRATESADMISVRRAESDEIRFTSSGKAKYAPTEKLQPGVRSARSILSFASSSDEGVDKR